jgi:hypothetical protein
VVLSITRIGESTLVGQRLIHRIEIAVLEVLVNLAMEQIGAAPHDQFELAAGAVAYSGANWFCSRANPKIDS